MTRLKSAPRALAIVLPSWVGDTVMATPAIRACRAAVPASRLVGIGRPGLEELLRGLDWFDELITCDSRGLAGAWRLARSIRRAGADAVLLLPNSFKSALGARLSGAAQRLGYARDGRGFLLSHPVPSQSKPRRPVPAIAAYAELVERALGAEVPDRTMQLAVTAAQRQAGQALLTDVPRPFVLLNPGGNRPDKRWPAARFAAVADALREQHGLSSVVSGSPGERAVIDAVLAAADSRPVDLSTRGVTLGTLKAVAAEASLMVTNDTGPRHIAAALGTPVVTLFGPTDHRWTTLEGARERIVLAEPFLPEHLMADRHARACAVERISVGDVLHAVASLLAEAIPTRAESTSAAAHE